MATIWDVAAAGWAITVLGWLLSPIFHSLLPNILAYLGFDATRKLLEPEIRIIPELKQTMRAVDEDRMMQRGKKLKSDVAALDKMAAMLRHSREDAEDIFDDAQEKIVSGCCHRLYHAFAACIALYKSSCVWIAHIARTNSARLLQWARNISLSLFLLRRSEEPIPVNISDEALEEAVAMIIDIATSDEPIPVTTNAEAFDEPVPVTAGAVALGEPDPTTINDKASDEPVSVTTSATASNEPNPMTISAQASDEPVPVTTPSDPWLSCLCSSFNFFKNYCTSLYNWLVHVFEVACFYRD